MRRLSLLSVTGLLGTVCAADFQTDVLPILQKSCYKCHGNGKRRGNLSLEKEDIGKFIGPSGPIRPGKVEESKIITLIKGEDGDRMPLKGRPLGKEEIAIITEWVEEGARLGQGVPYAERHQKPLIPARKWTNTKGVGIVADLLGVKDGKAILRLGSGKVSHYPLEKLSEESRKVIEEALSLE